MVPSMGVNNTTTVFLQGWFWHYIFHMLICDETRKPN